MSRITALEHLLAQGRDDVLIRFGLAQAYFDAKDYPQAILHAQKALAWQPHYSVAWKLLGQSFTLLEQPQAATAAYQQGISVAEQQGDMQVLKEMQLFLRRLRATYHE